MPRSSSSPNRYGHVIAASLAGFILAGLALVTLFQAQPVAGRVPSAPTATITRRFQPNADSFIVSNLPTINFSDPEDDQDANAFLEIGAEGQASTPVSTESWLFFDLSSIPWGTTIEQAWLHAQLIEGGFGPLAWVDARIVMGAWEEASLDWETRPTLGYIAATSALTPEDPTPAWDLTDLVQAWVGGGDGEMPNYGLALQSQPGLSDEWLRFLDSRESGQPPELEVRYSLPGNALIFNGSVLEAGFGPAIEHPLAGIPVRLYGGNNPVPEVLLEETETDLWGIYTLHASTDLGLEFFFLVMGDENFNVVSAEPGTGGMATSEGYIQFLVPTPGTYLNNLFIVEPAVWPELETRHFSGVVQADSGDPVPGVEVVLYGAEDPLLPSQVLAGASSATDGSFDLAITLPTAEIFANYVLIVADDQALTVDAIPGEGGQVVEGLRVAYPTPPPGDYPGTLFTIAPPPAQAPSPLVSQQTELRPVVVVMLNPRCTCNLNLNACTNITNPNVLTQFGQTIFNTSGDSVHNFFLENSQGQFGLQQAGLFQVTPVDNPSTPAFDESTNCSFPGGPGAHRAYVTQQILANQLGFNFAQFDQDQDQVIERDELIVLVTANDPHTGNARTWDSNPARLTVGNLEVEVYYPFMQPGTDFYTIAHELAHALPLVNASGSPGDQYGGEGNSGTYGLMDNHCHGRINLLNPNTPYTPTQHIVSRRPHLDPWNKIALNWITPTLVTGNYGWASIQAVEDGGKIYKLLPSGHASEEYFLVENRFTPSSQYETALPTDGLGIWLINEKYLPDQRRAIRLVRAGGGANSGAATDNCNDDNDATALWEGDHDFHNNSTPNSRWTNGAMSNVAALCIEPPQPDTGVYLSANWTGTVLPEDAGEPNPNPATATPLVTGTSQYTLHAPCDQDVYTYTHWTNTTITLTVAAYFDAALTQPAPPPLIELTDDNFYQPVNVSQTGGLSYTFNFKGQAAVTISGSAAVYYRMTFLTSQPLIPPDRFDDQLPTGEYRNDTMIHRTVITDSLEESSPLLPGLKLSDLNFDTQYDQDYFEFRLPPEMSSSGQIECLPAIDPRLNDPNTFQGQMTLRVYPFFKRPLTIAVFNSSGSLVTNYSSSGPYEFSFECPHKNFSDGVVIVGLTDPSLSPNFYELALSYQRWNTYMEFPEWLTLTDPPMFRPLPYWREPLLRWIYPATGWLQDLVVNGTPLDPMPLEFVPFFWEQPLPFHLEITSLPGTLGVALFDVQRRVVGEALPMTSAPDRTNELVIQQLEVPSLSPGWYALGFDGPQQITDLQLRLNYHQVYIPLVRQTH